MNIVLVGFMCSGKSRVGQIVAKKLNWPFFDTDEIISKDVGASIADIIKTQGEPAFRNIEKKAVNLVSTLDKSVIATGGGVPIDPSNMAALTKNGKMVWLKITPETVLKRVGNLKSRPLIDPKDPLGSVRKRMIEREPAYSKAAHTIVTDDMTPEQAADAVLALRIS